MTQKQGLQAGVYLNLPMQQYHEDPAIGGTMMKAALISDEAIWSETPDNPDREKLDTVAFKLGRAYHQMILEPEKDFPFEIKKGVKSSKVEGMIGEGDYNDLLKMYKRLTMQPAHWNMLHGGFPEVSIIYPDEETGLMCKIRPDNFAPEFQGDCKTAKGISDKDLFFDFPKNGYLLTGYRYLKGVQALKKMIREGYKMPAEFDKEFIDTFMLSDKQHHGFVLQDKNAPYPTRCWLMTPYAAEQGHAYYQTALGRLKDYYENPKYIGGVQPLGYPDFEDITQGMIWESKNF